MSRPGIGDCCFPAEDGVMSGAKRVRRYPDGMRIRAVRMVFEHQHEYPWQWKAIESISKKLKGLPWGRSTSQLNWGQTPPSEDDLASNGRNT